MAFGKRTTARHGQATKEPSQVISRRGGYPLGVLTVAFSSYLCALVMAFIPYFNPTNHTAFEIARLSVVAVLNVTFVAAVVLILVDALFRARRVSAVWAYALAGGGLTFGLFFWLAVALTGSAGSPAFLAILVFLPTAMGGAVLGMFRTPG